MGSWEAAVWPHATSSEGLAGYGQVTEAMLLTIPCVQNFCQQFSFQKIMYAVGWTDHSGMPLGLQLALELFSKSIIAQTSLRSHDSKYLDSKCQVDDPGTSEASHHEAPEHPLRR